MSSLQTEFNVEPYFDDYNPSKNYYRVLFKPGVAVQTRELTQLQTILQSQIEKFGDNIFKRGTIIEGCSLTYHTSLPYIKIRDLESDETPVNVELYKNLYVRNSANVSAYIVDAIAGFESRSPDLNTLFVRYNSSGVNSNTNTFSPSETLTVYSPDFNLFEMNVIDGSGGFSNSDTIEVISSLALQNTTGGSIFTTSGFKVNDVIQNGFANAIIVEANTAANSSVLLLRIKPLPGDLKSANTVKWKFNKNESILNANTGNSAVIVDLVGSGAKGSLITNSLGKISSVTVTSRGSGYYYNPFIATSITSNSNITNSEISQLNIEPQNFLTNIVVANTAANPIGVGFGLTVDEGVIYQKGFFSRVENQLIVVEKYSNTGFTKSVGFLTEEDIIDSNEDQSLLDNATGSPNHTAPGADRLKLTPSLYVLSKTQADANTEFLPVVEFADGNPYKQNKRTVYNILGDELARRTFEESGDYVLDQFILTTKDSSNISDASTVFKINIDPGSAYIKGYRVETTANYTANVDKGIDTINAPNSTIKIGYGSYIKLEELGGIFQFNTGSVVEFYDAPKDYITSAAGSTITPAGNLIGQARMRSILLDSGEVGTATAVYTLYLFDIVMQPGKNFSNIKSVYHNGTNKGIADIILDNGLATLYDSGESALLFKPVNAIKSANNITYTYRTIDQSKTANTAGYVTLTPGANENYPYTGTLSTIEKRDLLIVPLSDYQASANAPGSITITSGSANVTGSGSTNFINAFKPGDFVKFANSTSNEVKQIKQIVNTTLITLTSSATATRTGNAVLYFPKNIPISLTSRAERTVNVAANGQMTIFLANTIANTSGSSASANLAITYNVTANNVNPGAKTSNRSIYTRVRVANNAGLTAGPWALGVADAYRLRKVYKRSGANTSVTANNAAIVSATDFIPVPNNIFGHGDTITYTTSTGNTTITGLANNTTYKVALANTSGFKLANSANISQIMNITAGISEVGHNFTGSPLFFTEDLFGVQDVTNDFYIDNNQKEDYLDISYLYKKPRSSDISANDVILIKYDAFTSGAGVKTVSSYNINDSANLTALSVSSSVNTLELPEMIGTNGRYYDIRDQFDFRQTSSNTIPLSSNSSTDGILNPTEPSDANRFSAADQKYPVPNSVLTANITYYVARNDRVILDKNGRFVVVKGIANVLDAFPPEPKDSLTIQYLRIPPYPSLPFSLSAETVSILDTKVANEKYGKRKDNFKITTPIDKDQRARIQVKNYRMSDIATLERRMKDLEYYVSFTLAEAIAKSRFIPSAVDGGIDRFKFGFAVDPFTDYRFSDTDHPEFHASIVDDRLKPKTTEFNLEFFFDTSQNGDVAIDSDGFVTLSYIEHELIGQNDATDVTPNIVELSGNFSGGAEITTQTNSVTQTTAVVLEREKNRNRSDSPPYVFDEFFYTFSTITGPVEYYSNHRDNNMATEFYQSTSPGGPWTLRISSAAATTINDQDLYVKDLHSLNDRRKIEGGGGPINRKSYGPAGRFIEDQHKVLFTHNPEAGIYYKVRVYKGKNHGGQGKSGTYGYKLFYPTDTETNTGASGIGTSGFGYIGTGSIVPNTFVLSMSAKDISPYGYTPQNAYVGDSQKFLITMWGLKPSTYHDFIFAGENHTEKCKQIRTTTTNTTGLLSGADGKIQFEYYYDAGFDELGSDVQQRNKLISSIVGVKMFALQNSDISSYAAGRIDVKNYVAYSPEIMNSPGQVNTVSATTVNPVINISGYDYSSSLSSVIDTNISSPTTISDENTVHINFTGQTAYVSGGGRREFGENIREF